MIVQTMSKSEAKEKTLNMKNKKLDVVIQMQRKQVARYTVARWSIAHAGQSAKQIARRML